VGGVIEIPPGASELRAIAAKLKRPALARRWRANGANPVSIIVPCQRVIDRQAS